MIMLYLLSTTIIESFTFVEDDKTIGLITVFIEQKLIHGGKCVAHIEDLVVDKGHRKKGISTALINHVVKYVERCKLLQNYT